MNKRNWPTDCLINECMECMRSELIPFVTMAASYLPIGHRNSGQLAYWWKQLNRAPCFIVKTKEGQSLVYRQMWLIYTEIIVGNLYRNTRISQQPEFEWVFLCFTFICPVNEICFDSGCETTNSENIMSCCIQCFHANVTSSAIHCWLDVDSRFT